MVLGHPARQEVWRAAMASMARTPARVTNRSISLSSRSSLRNRKPAMVGIQQDNAVGGASDILLERAGWGGPM